MEKCKTCEFWTEGKKGGNPGPYAYTCPEGYGGCGNFDKIKRETHMVKDAYSDWSSITTDMMITENDEEWGFWTGADFGCIHYETKLSDNAVPVPSVSVSGEVIDNESS